MNKFLPILLIKTLTFCGIGTLYPAQSMEGSRAERMEGSHIGDSKPACSPPLPMLKTAPELHQELDRESFRKRFYPQSRKKLNNPNRFIEEYGNRGTKALIIGGLHARSKACPQWVTSDTSCLVVNTDPCAEPDFLFDGFDKKSIDIAFAPLFDLIPKQDIRFWGLWLIRYEHISMGFDINQCRPIFQRLCSVLKPGGKFEYSSYWTKDLSFLFFYDKLIYKGAEGYHQQEETLERQWQELNATQGFDTYHQSNLPLELHDEIRELMQSDRYQKANEKTRRDLYIQVRERHLLDMESKGYGEGTRAFEKSKLYTQRLKIWGEIAKFGQENPLTPQGLWKNLKEKVDKGPYNTPFPIDLKDFDDACYLFVTPLQKYVEFFEEVLNLRGVQVYVDKEWPDLYSFRIVGKKK
jgi:hypothetical protein